jgi:CubicO group peptidase (beta-lactamase class C family)
MRLFVFALLLAIHVSSAAAGFEEAADYNARAGGVSMVVIEDGVVAFEDYPNGGGASKAWNLASGTKSFSCAIAAAAVQDGILSLDERAVDTLPEWRGDARKSRISIRQILSLTSGIRPTRIGRAPPYAEAILAPSRDDPGTAFEYGPVNFQIFGEIMRRKLRSFDNGRYADALAYLDARVLRPAGVSYAAWKRGGDGYPTLPQGAELTALEWAEFGEFVQRGGRAGGEQVIDLETLGACFIGSAVNPGYGLTWWLKAEPSAATLEASRTMTVATDLYTDPRRAALPSDLVVAAGAGGQRLYLIPSLKLVVARQYPRMIERVFRRRGAQFSDVEFLLRLLD